MNSGLFPAPGRAESASQLIEPARPKSPSRGLRILCADDNTMLGDVLLLVFKQAGHVAEHVSNGLEAWDAISKDFGHFNVLVTDHEMPSLNGLELVELLHQANFPGRIIVHTSGLTSEQAQSYREFSVAAIVSKSSRPNELLQAVEASVCR